MSHPLVRLSKLMNRDEIERSFGAHLTSSRGCPALSPRLVAGLRYLQLANDASDGTVVATWLENPYWQYFCREIYLQTKLPIDPSRRTRWRKRIGEERVEVLFAVIIRAARTAGLPAVLVLADAQCKGDSLDVAQTVFARQCGL